MVTFWKVSQHKIGYKEDKQCPTLSGVHWRSMSVLSERSLDEDLGYPLALSDFWRYSKVPQRARSFEYGRSRLLDPMYCSCLYGMHTLREDLESLATRKVHRPSQFPMVEWSLQSPH